MSTEEQQPAWALQVALSTLGSSLSLGLIDDIADARAAIIDIAPQATGTRLEPIAAEILRICEHVNGDQPELDRVPLLESIWTLEKQLADITGADLDTRAIPHGDDSPHRQLL